MANIPEYVKSKTSVRPTREDKGLTLEVKITAYDNGQLYIDNDPINRKHVADWLGGGRFVLMKMELLKALKRQHLKKVVK